MNCRLRLCVISAASLIAGACWVPGTQSQAGTTIADIVKNDGGKISSGTLMFMFTDNSVSSDKFDNDYTPTASNIVVDTVAGGLEFSLNPMATLRGQASTTDRLTITYTVAEARGIAGAGLRFSGFASGVDAMSSVTETFPDGHNEMLTVFTKAVDDMPNHNMNQNNQSVPFPDTPMTLSVMDVGQLSIPNRGGPGSSDTSLTSFVNTFQAVPEPSSFVMLSLAALTGLGVWRRARNRVAT
jgi:hypothetical protein